jgi:hypothetical protein
MKAKIRYQVVPMFTETCRMWQLIHIGWFSRTVIAQHHNPDYLFPLLYVIAGRKHQDTTGKSIEGYQSRVSLTGT